MQRNTTGMSGLKCRIAPTVICRLLSVLHFYIHLSPLICFSLLFADPWGKDANLVGKQQNQLIGIENQKLSILEQFGEKAIRFHQEVISPADGPRSHFIPSSSQYTLDAIHKYGFFRGCMMGCDRLMRENDDPWIYRKVKASSGCLMKFDPVK